MSLLHTSLLRMHILLERLQGLDFTRANQQPADLGLNAQEVFIPSPSGGRFLRRVFADLGVLPSDTALDIGCAKGSALRDLLRFPFARADGIELSPALADIARRNFSRLGVNRVTVFCMDARAFTRFGSYSIYYLYNPFPNNILDSVLQQLTAQAAAADPGQERLVVYNNPLGHDVMLRHGFTPMRRYPDFWGHGIQVYSNRPAASRLGRSQLV
jgi:SAM-dependent methyltransferase